MNTKYHGCKSRIKRCKWSIDYYRETINNPPTQWWKDNIDYAQSQLSKKESELIELEIELATLEIKTQTK